MPKSPVTPRTASDEPRRIPVTVETVIGEVIIDDYGSRHPLHVFMDMVGRTAPYPSYR